MEIVEGESHVYVTCSRCGRTVSVTRIQIEERILVRCPERHRIRLDPKRPAQNKPARLATGRLRDVTRAIRRARRTGH